MKADFWFVGLNLNTTVQEKTPETYTFHGWCFKTVFLIVAEIAPFGEDFDRQGGEKIKGAIGGRKNTKRAKMLNH